MLEWNGGKSDFSMVANTLFDWLKDGSVKFAHHVGIAGVAKNDPVIPFNLQIISIINRFQELTNLISIVLTAQKFKTIPIFLEYFRFLALIYCREI
jgi:hypothetical protein